MDFFVCIPHRRQLYCNYVIQGKSLTISLPWPLCIAKEPNCGLISKEVNQLWPYFQGSKSHARSH